MSFAEVAASAVEPVRVALYARISEDDRGDVLGVRRQIYDGRKLAGEKAWTVAGEYVDNDIRASGSDQLRPSFERLLQDVRAGLIDAIIATEPERITRRPKELESILEVCQQAGVKYLAYVDRSAVDLATGDGILMARIKAAIGADEVEKIKRRVKAKKDELARDGKSAGGPRAFGFQAGYAGHVAVEAEMIRDAARRVLDGEPVNSIAASWNEAGAVTSKGKTWRPGPLNVLLRSGRIAGLREHHGVVIRTDLPGGGAAWAPIIDAETRNRLLAVLAPAKNRPGRTKGKRQLTGLLRCGRCSTMWVAGTNNGHRAYNCQYQVGLPGGCGLSIKAEPLEALVREAAIDRLDDGLLDALKAQRSGGVDPVDIGRTVELEARIDELDDMLGAGEMTRASYVRALAVADGELQVVIKRVQRAQTRSAIDGFLDSRAAIPERFDASTLPVKRAVLGALLEVITIGPAVRGRARFDPLRVDLTWRF